MNKLYIVRLESQERADLERLVSTGKGAARKLTHARILLLADVSESGPGWSDKQIGTALSVTPQTVANLRLRCVEQGLEAALERKKREGSPTPRILDGEKEARLVAICCSAPPEGRARWTLNLLSDRLVELDVVESISHDTVGRVLKKRAKTVAKEDVVYSAGTQCRVRLRDGKRTGGVPSTV